MASLYDATQPSITVSVTRNEDKDEWNQFLVRVAGKVVGGRCVKSEAEALGCGCVAILELQGNHVHRIGW
jgi:hypothetical protein